ncbi:trans-sialidase [Trypanosoma cruzi]|nr:trans-sialidase [Trypanosoma cruzi]
MECGATSWVDEDPLLRVSFWVITGSVCAVCRQRAVAVSRIAGRTQEPAIFPSWVVVFVGAMQTSSTCTRTSRVVPGHSCGTLRYEGTCYRGAGITIYLRKHEGGQQRHNCACCSRSALMLSLLRMENAMVRPAPVACPLMGKCLI